MNQKVNIRPLTERDDPTIKNIIETVMPEFGADGQGFAIHDQEVQGMSKFYQQENWSYHVVEIDGRVVGGAGLAPLEGGEASCCELKKMYFLPIARGKGLAQKILEVCLKEAKGLGFETMYIETLKRMEQANSLYLKNGFAPLNTPMGNTGHFGCDTWYFKNL